jgi:hypothetical protein
MGEVLDRAGVKYSKHALEHRNNGTESENEKRDDEASEVKLAAVSEGAFRTWGEARSMDPVE